METLFIPEVLYDSFAVGALNKVGTGTLTLGGSNGYMGLTSVNGGTLAVTTGGVLERWAPSPLRAAITFWSTADCADQCLHHA